MFDKIKDSVLITSGIGAIVTFAILATTGGIVKFINERNEYEEGEVIISNTEEDVETEE